MENPSQPLPDSYKGVRAALTAPHFFETDKWRQQQERAVRTLAHPEILEFERKLVKALRRMNIPMFCHCCWRGSQEQKRLFEKGFSKAGFGKSPHNYGMAVDIIHSKLGWEINRHGWELIGHVGKEVAKSASIKIVWGGDFKSLWDPAHWELADWRDRIEEVSVPDGYVF